MFDTISSMARTKFTAKKTKKTTRVSEEEEEQSNAEELEEQRRLQLTQQREIEAGRAKRRCREEELDIEERELNIQLRREEAMFNRSLQTQGHDLELRKLLLQEKQLEHDI